MANACAGQGGGAISMDGYDKMWVQDSTFSQSIAGVSSGAGLGGVLRIWLDGYDEMWAYRTPF